LLQKGRGGRLSQKLSQRLTLPSLPHIPVSSLLPPLSSMPLQCMLPIVPLLLMLHMDLDILMLGESKPIM